MMCMEYVEICSIVNKTFESDLRDDVLDLLLFLKSNSMDSQG